MVDIKFENPYGNYRPFFDNLVYALPAHHPKLLLSFLLLNQSNLCAHLFKVTNFHRQKENRSAVQLRLFKRIAKALIQFPLATALSFPNSARSYASEVEFTCYLKVSNCP